MKIPFKYTHSKNYWILRNKVQQFQFRLKRQLYIIKKLFNNEIQNTKSSIHHARLSLWSIFKAVWSVALIFFIEDIISKFWQTNFILFPNWLINLNAILPKPTYPNDRDAIIELISVIASVSGVILALFYPMLATIASTAYAKVHSSIRNLLLEEKGTQGYLKRLTFLTASSIVVLLFMSFDFLPGNLILSFLTFYSLTSLFGILKIGMGVYNFFDPSTLASSVYSNLTNSVKNVTIQGEYWNEKKFQYHYYKIAYEQTENLSLLMSLCLKDELKESSFKTIFKISTNTLRFYLIHKPKIPIDSQWFPNIYEHRSYFESDITMRQLSLKTNTYTQPKVKPNHYWLEERIVKTLSNNLESAVKNGYLNILGESILLTHGVFDSLGSMTDLRTGEILLDEFLKIIQIACNNNDTKNAVSNYENWKEELGCVQTYCFAILRLQIGVFESLCSFNSDKIIQEYQKINWEKENSIYSTTFIPEIYDLLKKIREFTENEKAIEEKQITPEWYYLQLLSSVHLKHSKDKINQTINLFESHLLSLAKHFDKENNCLLASFTAQIGLEVVNKLNFRLVSLKKSILDIDKMEVCKGQFDWTKTNFEEIENSLSLFKNECINILSRNIENMSLVKWNNQFPDVFSHSYSLISNMLNECFKKNTFEIFQKCFAPFLKSSFSAFGNLNTIFQHYDRPQNISYQALLDPMEISGYAYIYSVIYNSPNYWEEVKRSWDESFLPSKENIDLLVSYYSYYKTSLYGTGINDSERHQRERTLSDVTQALKIRVQHIPDFIVKLFVSDNPYHHNHYNVAELFIEIYLFTFIESKDSTNKFTREIFNQWMRNINNPNPNDNDF